MAIPTPPPPPKHLREVLGMIYAADHEKPIVDKLAEKMKVVSDDEAVEILFDELKAYNLNPATLETMEGLLLDDLEYIVNDIIIRAYERKRKAKK